MHEVRAFVRIFRDRVGRAVDDVGVVAKPADERVNARSAIEHIAPRIAGDGIVLAIACAIDRRSARERQVLDIVAEREGDRRLHTVRALAHIFRHDIASAVDDIGVVARTANHRVSARTANQHIRPCRAGQRVVAHIPEQRRQRVLAIREIERRAARRHNLGHHRYGDLAAQCSAGLAEPRLGRGAHRPQ